MKKLLFFLFGLLLISLNSFSQEVEKENIKKCYETYKKSLLNNDGKQAYACLDKKTRKYYDELLDKIKTYDSIQIEKESIVNKLSILTIRHRVPKDEILKMNGEGLFIYSIDYGFVDKGSVQHYELGTIEFRRKIAKAQMMSGNLPSFYKYLFYKQKNQWYINLTSLHPMSNYALKKMIEELQQTEDDFILYSLASITRRNLDNSIWHPLVK
ncbi:MAG: hypothetical protein Q8862_03560 [Bacteroidota bacterium]|nr:hypothetical protein [Bacteroidota bacterium]